MSTWVHFRAVFLYFFCIIPHPWKEVFRHFLLISFTMKFSYHCIPVYVLYVFLCFIHKKNEVFHQYSPRELISPPLKKHALKRSNTWNSNSYIRPRPKISFLWILYIWDHLGPHQTRFPENTMISAHILKAAELKV